jgi:predicted ATPase
MPVSEAALSQVREPDRYPEFSRIRELFRGWRFYHHFPTHDEAPARQVSPSIRTTVLSVDGHDLASALGTIAQIGNDIRLHACIERAFPGQKLILAETEDHNFTLHLQDRDLLRPLEAQELSDGTLQYLCLVAALLTPRPPLLMAFNEPESSLHPRLYEPLARLLVEASERSQIWLTTHSVALADHVRKLSGATPLELEKVDGETRVVGRTRFGFER